MGKKKGKDRSPVADCSPETSSGVSCSHIRKGIERSLLKKISFNEHWSLCQDCEAGKTADGNTVEEKDLREGPADSEISDDIHRKGPADSGTAEDDNREGPADSKISEDEALRESPAVWMCLKCGHRGCGRFSDHQHAIKHYEKPRSEPHSLVLNLDVWNVWCYICDEEVQYSSTGQLAQLVTNIRKQVLAESGRKTSNRKGKKEVDIVEIPPEQTPDKEMESKKIQTSNSKHDDSPKKQKVSAGVSGAVCVRGLSNLGNTCFFNAVVQNLSQTHLLRQQLKQVADEQSGLTVSPALSSQLEPLQIQLERPGSLTLAMCQLLNEIQETKKGVVTPKELFAQVCKKASRFRGFQQQDSQELLRYLLDGMRAEEVKRVSSGILDALKKSGKCLEAEQTKKVIKEYEKNGTPMNFVERVFGGELSSTVMCKECRTVSLVTETFLDLSLPVADEAYRKKNQKKVVQSRSRVDDDDEPTPLANGSEDMPTGAGSKYQQKKAKKQAKKQAKTQRRQQKLGSKVNLDVLTNQNAASSTDPEEVLTPSDSAEGGADVETGERTQDHINQSPDVNASPLAPSQKDEDDEEPEQEPATSVNNRFIALSEDQTSEEMSVEGEKTGGNEIEEEGGAEEDRLVEELDTMSLNATSDGHHSEMENGHDVSVDAKEYTVVNQDPELAFHTLATRAAPEKQECSVESCLYQFSEVEQLTENNRLMCVTCTKRQSGPKALEGGKKGVYRDALKQMLISSPPPVLTLHLKRFQQVSYSVCKVNRHVQFPQILDLAPFCSLKCKGVKEGETRVLYSLYGIVEHSGTMRSGHYTAFVKSRTSTHNSVENGSSNVSGDLEASKGSWFHISDTSVHPVTEAKVQSSQAYLLFYEKIS